jgi:hypothetical protein
MVTERVVLPPPDPMDPDRPGPGEILGYFRLSWLLILRVHWQSGGVGYPPAWEYRAVAVPN